MAKKKPRTPTPPRRVQAPQQRTAQRDGEPNRTLLYAIAASGVVALAVVIGVIFATRGGGSSTVDATQVASLMSKAGCTYRNVTAYIPKGQSNHMPGLNANDHWNTSPPSNGQHYPQWAVWGFYTTPINPRRVVHNEEHGGVVLWWGSQVPASTVAKLKAFYLQEPTGMFGTPYPSLGSKIAITAWTGDPNRYRRNNYNGEGHIATCPSYTPATEKAFAAFRKAYRGHGPEGTPLAADAPGLGP